MPSEVWAAHPTFPPAPCPLGPVGRSHLGSLPGRGCISLQTSFPTTTEKTGGAGGAAMSPGHPACTSGRGGEGAQLQPLGARSSQERGQPCWGSAAPSGGPGTESERPALPRTTAAPASREQRALRPRDEARAACGRAPSPLAQRSPQHWPRPPQHPWSRDHPQHWPPPPRPWSPLPLRVQVEPPCLSPAHPPAVGQHVGASRLGDPWLPAHPEPPKARTPFCMTFQPTPWADQGGATPALAFQPPGAPQAKPPPHASSRPSPHWHLGRLCWPHCPGLSRLSARLQLKTGQG